MTIGLIIWDKHWRGSAFALNLFKCNLASIGFAVLSVTTRSGELFPSEIFTSESVGFLMLSATIGILIGDLTWLEGLRLLGARRVIVVDTCKPFLAALFGWAILGEALRPAAFGGMALTMVGVLIVSFEREKELEESNDTDGNPEEGDTEVATESCSPQLEQEETGISLDEEVSVESVVESTPPSIPVSEEDGRHLANGPLRILTSAVLRRGYAMAVVNVVLDTYGSLLTKEYGVGMTTWEINLIRFGFSGISMLILSLMLHLRHWIVMKNTDRDEGASETDEVHGKVLSQVWYSLPHNMKRRSWLQVSLGVLFVTFLTPALSNYALFQIALALALTLGSVGPLYSLPLTWLLQHDRPTWRGCVGAFLAVSGIIVLSFFGQQQ